MTSSVRMMLTLVAVLGMATTADAARLQTTPMARVVGLLTELEAKIEADGKMEQKSYDKYACWCEATLGRKANDIATAKEQIEDLQALITKLKAEIASHGAEVKNLKKDIEDNLAAQEEATEVRSKEHGEFNNDKTESEQCIGALEAAVGVLTGAGENRGKFLQTNIQDAQLLSVVSGVRGVLKSQNKAKEAISNKDLQVVQRFVEHPEAFFPSRAGLMQVSNNPFGDYAPQSTQIQGILKGMYDAFTMDLEKDNCEEADAQKAHEELMATKAQELATLKQTLETQELDFAEKSKKLADSETLQDDLKVQLKADEKFFDETKKTCQVRASEWAERTRLRTEELMGIGKAIEIMSGPEAQKIFANATTTFIQISNVEATSARSTAFSQLRKLASKNHDMNIAQIAVQVKTGGHFDKVMASIDAMIQELRKEEAEDIAHRDRCQRAENKNANDMEDLNHEIKKSDDAIKRMEDVVKTKNGEIDQLKKDIASTQTDMKQLLEMRNGDVAEFKQALKDDAAAVKLMTMAMEALGKFYKRNKVEMGFVQQPEYSVDQDKAPELAYDGPKYGGRSSETGGLVAIIKMLIEDLEKEMRQARLDNDEAEAEYEEQKGALQKTLDAQKETKIATEKEVLELEAKVADTDEYMTQKSNDLNDEKKMESSIGTDCAWVATHFESRRNKRKNEIDGLEEAKNFLAGAESGDVI